MRKFKMSQLWIGILMIAIGGILAWCGQQLARDGWAKWQASKTRKDIFAVSFINSMRFKWPGDLFVLSKFPRGKVLSPVSLALWVEVTNNKETISRIHSYKARALLRYDEGGTNHITQTENGGSKFRYKPSGKTVEKWRDLYSMGHLHDQVYFITNKGLSGARRLDFSKNSFDDLARITQLRPGESILGWIFFELDPDLRGQLPEIKKLELSLRNSAGEEQAFHTQRFIAAGSENGMTYLSGGEWNLLEGEYDLTKEQYMMAAMVDLGLPVEIKGPDEDITPPRFRSSENEVE